MKRNLESPNQRMPTLRTAMPSTATASFIAVVRLLLSSSEAVDAWTTASRDPRRPGSSPMVSSSFFERPPLWSLCKLLSSRTLKNWLTSHMSTISSTPALSKKTSSSHFLKFSKAWAKSNSEVMSKPSSTQLSEMPKVKMPKTWPSPLRTSF
jgi:hypothetical protein